VLQHWKIHHKKKSQPTSNPSGEQKSPTSDHDQEIDGLDQDIENVRPVFAYNDPVPAIVPHIAESQQTPVQTPISSSSIEQASVFVLPSQNERPGELWRMRRILMAQKLQIEQQLQRIDAELDFHHNVQ
jgi:hypothetical protein